MRAEFLAALAKVEKEKGCTFFEHFWRLAFRRPDLMKYALERLMPSSIESEQEREAKAHRRSGQPAQR